MKMLLWAEQSPVRSSVRTYITYMYLRFSFYDYSLEYNIMQTTMLDAIMHYLTRVT